MGRIELTSRSEPGPKQDAPVAGGAVERRLTLDNRRLAARYRLIGAITFGLPGFMTALAIAMVVLRGRVGVLSLAMTAVLYVLSVFGLELGYHRHFTHGAFDAPPMVRLLMGILGAWGVSGPVIYWVATHRLHHMKSDKQGDPHSPHLGVGALRGLWHAQVGWMLRTSEVTNPTVLAPDALRDPLMSWLNRHYPALALSGLVAPMAIGWLAGGWFGLLEGLLWGGFVRVFLVQALYTGALNSLCHLIGSREYLTDDRSTNTGWLVLPTLGQSWHNNHHAFPTSASLHLRWYQIDPTGLLVRGLAALGLASNLKLPSKERREKKRV